MAFHVGTCQSVPGTITRGSLPLIQLPTGDELTLKVIIATGAHPGPNILITVNIHGDEVNGIIVVHRFLEQLDLARLSGAVVVFPSLNPTGLLLQSRYPKLLQDSDPNRLWPDANPEDRDDKAHASQEGVADKKPKKPWESDSLFAYEEAEKNHKGPQEQVWQVIFNEFAKLKPIFHADLHTASTLSIPFVFLDRVLYDDSDSTTAEKARKDAEELFATTSAFVDALGLTVVRERPVNVYVKEKLHRSTSGATLNKLRIPSCTVELGPMLVALPSARDACVTALHNLLAFAKMDPSGSVQPITSCPVVKTQMPCRYTVYPRMPRTGVLDIVAEIGSAKKKGEVLAVVRNLDGSDRVEIVAEFDLYIIAWWPGVTFYKDDAIAIVGAVDETPTVVPWSLVNDKK